MTASSPRRRIALVIFRLAPAGGLEQHCLRLAEALIRRGAEVTLVTTRPPTAALPEGAKLELVAPRGRANHSRMAAFAPDAARAVAGRFDRTVAFHAIPGFDAIFCADPSRARPKGVRGWLPRYRTYARLEREAFAASGLTLTLSSAQRANFLKNHHADPARFVLLPPTVDHLRADPAAAGRGAQAAARAELDLPGGAPIWLWMGLQPKTKGLDRVLRALAAAPDAVLLVCGLDPKGKAGRGAVAMARRLGVDARVRWLGFVGEAQVTRGRAAADLLVHPSRSDVTGTVILEALASGLPVVTTEVCGYGEHVVQAGAGVVLAEPFRLDDLTRALTAATPQTLTDWSARALAYAGRDELYSGLERAADLILEITAAG